MTTDELFERIKDRANRELDNFREAQDIVRGDGGIPPDLVWDPMRERFDIDSSEPIIRAGADEEPDISFMNYHFWGLS